MSKSKILLYLLLAFLGGVFERSFFEFGQNYYLLALVFAVLLLLVFYKDSKAALVAFLILFFLLGVWRVEKRLQVIKEAALAGKTLQGEGVVQKVSQSSFGQNLLVEIGPKKVLVLLQAPQYPTYAYGDELDIACNLKIIENLPTENDNSFDYRMYMAKEGVLYRCDDAKYKKVAKEKGNKFFAVIFQLRQSFEEKISSVIPEPESALAKGLLLGGGSGLSAKVQADFSRTGMTHIVAVSGYNVTIIAEYLILLGIFLGLWRKQAIWFALVGIVLFVVASGLPASAVRAGVMGSILLWAMKNGRLAAAENAIILAAAIMLWNNVLLLRWDVGFQLSFLATLGIVLTSPFWEKSFIKKHQALGIPEVIALSLSAQIFVLPVIAYNFHMTSLISLLANVFILPIIPLSMLLVFLVSLAGFIFPLFSLLLAWLAYWPLWYELKLIHILAEFPWASMEIKNVSAGLIVSYYLILMGIIYYLRKTMQCISEK